MWKKRELAKYRYTMPDYKYNVKVDLTGFLNDLHNKQMDMIEQVVAIKESEGFPEATQVIEYIKGKI